MKQFIYRGAVKLQLPLSSSVGKSIAKYYIFLPFIPDISEMLRLKYRCVRVASVYSPYEMVQMNSSHDL